MRRESGTAAAGRQETAERLVAAGRRLFARRGYRGASVRAITHAAGANLGAVTYHFGSKRGLYEAVVDECLGPLRARTAAVVAGAGTPMEKIEALLRAFFAHLRSNPDTPQFMLQEVASGEMPSAPVRSTVEQVLGSLAALVEAGQRDGSVRPVASRLAAVSVVAQPVHLTLLSQLIARRWDGGVRLVGDADEVENHAVAFVRAALRAQAEG